MSEVTEKPKPGQFHLLPLDAWHLRPKKDIPSADWKNSDSYQGHGEWSPEQWAWEFLRRNRFFQQDCDSLDVTKLAPRQRKRLPPKWHLHTYKSYNEPFELGKNVLRPRWTVFSRAEVWDTNTGGRLNQTPQSWPFEDFALQPGQIALVIDLNDAVTMPRLLELQWSAARHQIDASLGRLRQSVARKSAGSKGKETVAKKSSELSKPRMDKLIDYLRIADAFSGRYPASLEEVCKRLHEDGRLRPVDSASSDEHEFSMKLAKNSLYKMIEASRSVIYDRGYLLLVEQVARKANRKEMIAPYWSSAKDAVEPETQEIDPKSPFAILKKLRG
jgi:hypothetical protein